MSDPRICDVGGGGLWMPLGGDAEQEIPKLLRAFIYGPLLLYTFLGVNIVADAFMAAIEAVTSSKKRVYNKSTGRYVTLLVWNDTVKNLSLLALGSSAPEILLSVIETLSNEFFSGALGPSTIVGSAAFNLLVIIAVCVIAIESPEVRFIKEITVYNVTAIFSLFAYGWLLIIVEYSSKDVIDLWEAIATFCLFPVLVGISFAADVGYFPFRKEKEQRPAATSEFDEESGEGLKAFGTNKKVSMSTGRARRVTLKQTALEKKVSQRSGSAMEEDGGRAAPGTASLETLPAGDDGELIRQDGKPIDNPRGVITFCSDTMTVEVAQEDKMICVPVLRRNGTSGTVSCKYHTEMCTAIHFFDFEEVKGQLAFEPDVQQTEICIKIKGKKPKERSDHFQLVLDDIQGGAQFNPNDDGGEDSSILTVSIQNENEGPVTLLKNLSKRFLLDADVNKFGREQYFEQIKAAISVNGDSEEDDPGPPSKMDIVMHYLTLPWKLLYAVATPPPIYAGGWLLFCVALVHIALITAVICDLSSAFGCCIDVDDSVTAITVVALGTSLPDLFASQAAAIEDAYADASIVNVTGSNSVNVFLGIGIPWLMCAVYWSMTGASSAWTAKYGTKFGSDYPDGAFIVEAGTLAFSVFVFTSEAIICITTLRVKRLLVGGELGGPKAIKNLTGMLLVLLWLTYIVLSTLRSRSDGIDMAGKASMVGLACIAIAAGVVVEVGTKIGAIKKKELGGGQPAGDDTSDAAPTNDTQALLEASSEPSDEKQGEWTVANESPVDTDALANGVSVLPNDESEEQGEQGEQEEQNPAPKAKSKAKSKAQAKTGASAPKATAKPKAATVGKQLTPPSNGDAKPKRGSKPKSKASAKKKKNSGGTDTSEASITSSGTGK